MSLIFLFISSVIFLSLVFVTFLSSSYNLQPNPISPLNQSSFPLNW